MALLFRSRTISGSSAGERLDCCAALDQLGQQVDRVGRRADVVGDGGEKAALAVAFVLGRTALLVQLLLHELLLVMSTKPETAPTIRPARSRSGAALTSIVEPAADRERASSRLQAGDLFALDRADDAVPATVVPWPARLGKALESFPQWS